MLTLHWYKCKIVLDYDDGGGNTGTVTFDVIDQVDILLKEGDHWEPTTLEVLPLKEEEDMTPSSTTNTGGTGPVGSIDLTLKINGAIELPTYTTLAYVSLSAWISEIEDESKMLEETMYMIAGIPVEMSCTIKQISGVGHSAATLITESYSANDKSVEHDFEFNEVDEGFTLTYYPLTNFEVEDFNFSDMAFVVMPETLALVDYTQAGGIETVVQVLTTLLTASSGKWGGLIGNIVEYTQDGEFGDLDLPLRVVQQRVAT